MKLVTNLAVGLIWGLVAYFMGNILFDLWCVWTLIRD